MSAVTSSTLRLSSTVARAFSNRSLAFCDTSALRCRSAILWFANNRSANNLLCSNTFITVVESAELRHCNDLSDAHRLSRKRTLLTEAQVGSRVMVVAEIARQCSFGVADVHNDVIVETLPANGADESFGVWILPRTSGCGQNFFHSQRLNSRSNLGAVNAVPIADKITGTVSIGERLDNLLRSPGRSRMLLTLKCSTLRRSCSS